MNTVFERTVIRIGTRKSALALAQSALVGDAICEAFPDMKIEYIPMSTLGDKRLDISLQEIGGKGVFTKELEEALIRGEIDMAVHSAKDMPLSLDTGLEICPVQKRAAVNDVLVAKKGLLVCDTGSGISVSGKLSMDAHSYENGSGLVKKLPEGARVGTSSKRRAEQVLQQNPDVNIVPIRGNVMTRISKIFEGDVDAVLLARAGLDRLMADSRFSQPLRERLKNTDICDISAAEILPAPAQGVLCVEFADKRIADICKKIQDNETAICFRVERKYLELLQADCHTGTGIYIGTENGAYFIKAYFEGRYADVYGIQRNESALISAVEETVKKLAKHSF